MYVMFENHAKEYIFVNISRKYETKPAKEQVEKAITITKISCFIIIIWYEPTGYKIAQKLSVITLFFNMRVFNIFIYYPIFTSKFFVVSYF